MSLLVSVVFGAILLSILIGFGIKTYLHLRHSQKSSTDEDTPAVRADLPVKIELTNGDSRSTADARWTTKFGTGHEQV